jgi:hypothetical protein
VAAGAAADADVADAAAGISLTGLLAQAASARPAAMMKAA